MNFRKSFTALAVIVTAAFAVKVSAHAGLATALTAVLAVAVLFGMSQMRPMAQLNEATLVVSILTGKVIEAFRTKVPELGFFSNNFGAIGSPVKWLQDVIAQIAQRPTASDHTPGSDLTASAQNVKDLVKDVKVRIGRAKVVKIKLPTIDAVSLLANNTFLAVLKESGIELGRAVIRDAILEADAQNFSHSIVEADADADYVTLGTARRTLNTQGAASPRFMLGNSTFMGNIADDPDVRSGDFHGQQIEGDPYVYLRNIQGFEAAREFPGMPSGTRTIGTFVAVAASDVCTVTLDASLSSNPLKNGDRVRVSSATTLPAGLSAATNYFIIDADGLTFKLSATVGGAAVNITDTGTGAHTIQRYEELNAFAFEKRAIHIEFKNLDDNTELARTLGVPVTFLSRVEVDPETGVPFSVYMYLDPKTQDLYAAVVVHYGISAGRGAAGADVVAGALAADSGLDPAGLRIVAAAGAA